MRIVIPLFWLSLDKVDRYPFDADRMFIGPFDVGEIPKIPLFSEQDLRHMSEEAPWALIYEDSDFKGFKPKVNILLMAFRLCSEKRYPFAKYIICSENHSLCKRLNDTITYNYSYPRTDGRFDSDELARIRDGFLSLTEMDRLSIRTHNALYFLYRAWHSTKWIDSFILMMCSLESLFSKDRPGSATAVITTRVSSLLGSRPKCTRKDIEDLYELRSRMTHGNIEASEDPGLNLGSLNHLEFVTVDCFRALLKDDLYKQYKNKDSRDRLMGGLNKGT